MTDLCTGCHKPAPRDWCWEGRHTGCPLVKPPRWATESVGIEQLWRRSQKQERSQMPCYEPPYDTPAEGKARRLLELSQREDRYIATLKDIEVVCKTIPDTADENAYALAQAILGIIDAEWGEKK